MKATMSRNGVITISGETPLEAYALAQFSREALIDERDIMRGEDCKWRGSRIVVCGVLKEEDGNGN